VPWYLLFLLLSMTVHTNNYANDQTTFENSKQRGLAKRMGNGKYWQRGIQNIWLGQIDTINTLKRGDQSNIFRLRTQHIQLNSHLSRIQSQHAQVCHLCTHPGETVGHHLFECPTLDSIRKRFRPPDPDI
jgi:hypothetical protein